MAGLKWTQIELDKIQAALKEGMSYIEIAQMVLPGRSVHSIRQKVDARHYHKGHSMYNPSHGALKKNYRGSDADIIIGGHTHQSAYTLTKNPQTQRIGHSITVGSYKLYDDYARSGDFEDTHISPSVLCVIDPSANAEGRITVFHDIRQGVRVLNALRGG